MRLVYCHACGSVSTNVMGERDVCTVCGSAAERMDWRRPWQYWVSSAMLLAAAAIFVWGPFTDAIVRAFILVVVVIASYLLSNWGMTQAKQKVLKEIARRKAAEERT